MGLFRSLFGPSRDEIWTSLRAQIGGDVQPGSFWHGEKLQAQSGDWIVTLDEYTTMIMAGKAMIPITHTRMRAPFPNPSGFRFSIHRASVFSTLAAFLGMQDIQVGYPGFDEDFVIKGNNEAIVTALCGSERLRSLISAQPAIQLTVRDDDGWFGAKYPPMVDVLAFDTAEGIRDVARLKGLYDVFAEVLGRLSEIGVAGKGTGGVAL